MKNLNTHKVVGATAMWALSIETMTGIDYPAILEHIAFIPSHAMMGDFKDRDLQFAARLSQWGLSALRKPTLA